MVKAIPSRFNPDLLARDSTQHSLILPIGQFSRLRTLLLASEAAEKEELSAIFRFSHRKDMVLVAGKLSTTFHLECQRCLEPMQLSIDEPFELAFAKTESAAQTMPEGLDPVVLDDDGQIHVVDLFEDELILHLPTVARHALESECEVELIQEGSEVQKRLDEQSMGDVSSSDAKKRNNPFDILKNLDLH